MFHGTDGDGELSVQVPESFWKVIVSKGANGPEAFGFVLEQDLSGVPLVEELTVPESWKIHMRSVGEIEDLLGGWAKLPWLELHDQFDGTEGRRIRAALEK